MTYLPGKPAGGDVPSISRADIQGNFAVANTVFAKNHFEFDYTVAADQGNHRFCVFLNQAVSPLTPGIDHCALYSKKVTIGGVDKPILFFRTGNSGTEYKLLGWHTPNNAASGKSNLSGGLILQWGSLNAPSGESAFIFFDSSYSAAPYSITVTARRSAAATKDPVFVSRDTLPNQFGFKIVNTDSSGHTVYWMAIGPE